MASWGRRGAWRGASGALWMGMMMGLETHAYGEGEGELVGEGDGDVEGLVLGEVDGDGLGESAWRGGWGC